jgi:hypothetical protein
MITRFATAGAGAGPWVAWFDPYCAFAWTAIINAATAAIANLLSLEAFIASPLPQPRTPRESASGPPIAID